MNTLLLDIGNSRLKWGLLGDAGMDEMSHIDLQQIEQHGVAVLREQLPEKFDAAIASNVAGHDIAAVLSAIGDIQYVQATSPAFGITIGYSNPQQLGVDRWVAMIGAHTSTDSACLVVDAGTAITLDALDPQGMHLGGQIMPGIRLMAEALGSSTSDLPNIESSDLQGTSGAAMFAASTTAAISQGILGAILGAVERSLQALRKSHENAEIFLTGGDAATIQRYLQQESVLRPHLVLEGLAIVSRARLPD